MISEGYKSAYQQGYSDAMRDFKKKSKTEELEKIKEKIDFEEKWLIGIKMENGFISIADIEVAMSGIRSVVSELKGDNYGQKL